MFLYFLSSVDANSSVQSNLRVLSETMHRRATTLALYNIPTFAVAFTLPVDPSKTISDISVIVKDVTQNYLKNYFIESLADTQTTLRDLQSVDLEISIKQTTTALSTGLQYYSELYGSAAFIEPSSNQPTLAQAQELMQNLVSNAFAINSLRVYNESMHDSLPGLENLVVDSELQLTANQPLSQGQNSQSTGWSEAEIVFLGFLVLFLVCSVSLISLYIRLDMRHKRYSRPMIIYDGEARDAYIGRNINKQASQSNDDSADNECGGNDYLLPVPEIEECSKPRRYIATSNPFELLYGASFLHSDKNRIEQKNVKPKKKKQTSNITPMLAIFEEEHEHGDSIHSVSSWDGGIASYLMRSLPSSMPWTTTKTPEVVKDEDMPFPYRDFPRHDGSPCVIYSPKDEIQLEFGPAAPGTVIDVNTNTTLLAERISSESPSLSNSYHSMNNSQHSAGSVDNFVDKLEALMLLKYKQYQERTKMEQERLERKKERDLKRALPPSENVVDLLVEPVSKEMTVSASPEPSIVTPEKFDCTPTINVSPADVTKMTEEEEQPEGVFT